MVELEFEGMKFKFGGEYRQPEKDDWILSDTGKIIKYKEGVSFYANRAIVHPVLAQYLFGGIVFQTEEEQREPKGGEWILIGNHPYCETDNVYAKKCTILHAIALENK